MKKASIWYTRVPIDFAVVLDPWRDCSVFRKNFLKCTVDTTLVFEELGAEEIGGSSLATARQQL